MDKPSLKALRELHEKATPGPWVAEADDTPNRCAGITGPTEYDDYAYRGDIVVTDSGVYPPRMPDAALIVAARNALPALLAIAEAARAEQKAEAMPPHGPFDGNSAEWDEKFDAEYAARTARDAALALVEE